VITREDQLKHKENFEGADGQLYLVRCYNCDPRGLIGRENWGPAVATGRCAWCGWSENSFEEWVENVRKVYSCGCE